MSNHKINTKRRRILRAQILKRDGDCCTHCGKPLGHDMTLEHIVPIKRGGSNALSNLALAHRKCNELAALLQ